MSAGLEPVRVITHQGKRILLVDLTNCSPSEVAEIVRALPERVTKQALGSVLALGDFTGASLDEDAVRAMQESAVFDSPTSRNPRGWG